MLRCLKCTFNHGKAGLKKLTGARFKELHAGGQYAVIPKNVTLKPKAPVTVPEGTVSEADQKIAVADAGGTKSVAVADTAMVIDKPAFDKALKGSDGFFHDWRGTVTAGAAFVAATQNRRTFKEGDRGGANGTGRRLAGPAEPHQRGFSASGRRCSTTAFPRASICSKLMSAVLAGGCLETRSTASI